MKEGYRFVDCDMHIMEPVDLFDKHLDPAFKSRITSSRRPLDGGSTGMRGRPLWFFDGTPTSNDGNTSQYNRIRGPLVSKRANTNVMFAVERGYDAESQVMGMQTRVSTSPCCSRPRGSPSSRATTWTRRCRTRSAAPTTTGCTISASTVRIS
jgi:hypothetical protein